MAVWGGLTNSCVKKRSKKQIKGKEKKAKRKESKKQRKGKIHPFEWGVPKNNQER